MHQEFWEGSQTRRSPSLQGCAASASRPRTYQQSLGPTPVSCRECLWFLKRTQSKQNTCQLRSAASAKHLTGSPTKRGCIAYLYHLPLPKLEGDGVATLNAAVKDSAVGERTLHSLVKNDTVITTILSLRLSFSHQQVQPPHRIVHCDGIAGLSLHLAHLRLVLSRW